MLTRYFWLVTVFTTSGKECKFPFRQGGRIHHHCITFLSSRPWWVLTTALSHTNNPTLADTSDCDRWRLDFLQQLTANQSLYRTNCRRNTCVYHFTNKDEQKRRWLSVLADLAPSFICVQCNSSTVETMRSLAYDRLIHLNSNYSRRLQHVSQWWWAHGASACWRVAFCGPWVQQLCFEFLCISPGVCGLCRCRCSLTHNFDRDRQFGFCAADKTQPEGLLTVFMYVLMIWLLCCGGSVCTFFRF